MKQSQIAIIIYVCIYTYIHQSKEKLHPGNFTVRSFGGISIIYMPFSSCFSVEKIYFAFFIPDEIFLQ